MDIEETIQKRSKAGRKAGIASGKARRQQSSNNDGTNVERNPTDNNRSDESRVDQSRAEEMQQEHKRVCATEAGGGSDTSVGDTEFQRFWELYPNKKSKLAARDAWNELKPDKVLTQIIINALRKQVKERKLLTEYNLFSPNWKNPVNWLREHCWEDEIKSDEEIKQMWLDREE